MQSLVMVIKIKYVAFSLSVFPLMWLSNVRRIDDGFFFRREALFPALGNQVYNDCLSVYNKSNTLGHVQAFACFVILVAQKKEMAMEL